MKKWSMPIFQSIVVIFIVISFYAISWFGKPYILRAEPFDPWDPFYGEYVMLQYSDLKAPNGIREGTVYFTLKTSKDGYTVIDKMKNESFFGGIKGTYYDKRVIAPQLEQFYVEQGQGLNLEKARYLQATIYVSPWGTIRPVKLEQRKEQD